MHPGMPAIITDSETMIIVTTVKSRAEIVITPTARMTTTGMAGNRVVTFRFLKLRRVIVNSDAAITLAIADKPVEYPR